MDCISWKPHPENLPEPDERLRCRLSTHDYWVAVKELTLSYHTPETMLFTICPRYGFFRNLSVKLSSNSDHPGPIPQWHSRLVSAAGVAIRLAQGLTPVTLKMLRGLCKMYDLPAT